MPLIIYFISPALMTCAVSQRALESCRNVFARVLTGERVILLGSEWFTHEEVAG
jgi:hypothetical protein